MRTKYVYEHDKDSDPIEYDLKMFYVVFVTKIIVLRNENSISQCGNDFFFWFPEN